MLNNLNILLPEIFLTLSIFSILMIGVFIKESFNLNKTLFSVLIILYPLVDLLRVFILRIKSGRSPFVADRRHLHHFILEKVSSKHVFICIIIVLIELSFVYFIIKLASA